MLFFSVALACTFDLFKNFVKLKKNQNKKSELNVFCKT